MLIQKSHVMSNAIQKVSKVLLPFILGGAILYWMYRDFDFSLISHAVRYEMNWTWMLLSLPFGITAQLFRGMRWRQTLEPIGEHTRLSTSVYSIFLSYATSLLIPRVGEFVRCGYVARRGLTYDKALGTVIVERTCDILAIVLLFAIALVTGWGKFGSFFMEQIWQPMTGRMSFSVWWIVLAVAVVVGGALWAVFHWSGSNKFCGKVAGAIRGLVAGFSSLGKMPRKWLFVLYTVGIWASYVAMSWSGLKALPMLSELTFADALFISAVGNIASVIPVPGGIGAYHYLVALTLQSLFGATWDTGILYATLCHETHAILIIVLGIVSYAVITVRRRSKQKA